MALKSLIKITFLSLALVVLPALAAAEEVYSSMESEEQGVASGSGLLEVRPRAPEAPQSATRGKSTKALPRQLPSRTKAPQTRVATRSAVAQQPSVAAVAAPPSQVTRVAPRASVPGMEIKVYRKGMRPPLNAAERGAFDPVPSDQADSLVRRLHLVEALITRHARAYDYRIHTVKELEGVLAELDRAAGLIPAAAAAQNSQVSAPQSGPAEKSPARFPIGGADQPDPTLQQDVPPSPPPVQATPATPSPLSEPETDVKDVE